MNANKLVTIVLLLIFILGGGFGVRFAEEILISPPAQRPAMKAIASEQYQRAGEILRQDAEKNDPFAQWAFAELIDMDLIAVIQPSETASGFYRKAAETGFRPAQVKLGIVKPAVGDFTAYNDQESRLLHIQAFHGDSMACLQLEQWYLKQNKQADSLYWLQKAIQINKRDDMAIYYAAKSLFYLHGSESEQRQAIELMRKLAEQGMGQTELAQMLETAKGRQRNGWEAYKWYSKAAEKGNSNAQVRLGVMYLEGDLIGMQSDYEALRWLKKATAPRKDRLGYSYFLPEAKLAFVHYLSKGLGGLHESTIASSIVPSELEYLMLQDGYDFQKAFYATAIGIRNTNIDFVRKEVSAAAEYGKQECGEEPECLAFTTWFQVLAGQSSEVIADTKQLKEIGTAKALFHLGHALLLHNRQKEALQMYEKGIAKATRHELFLLDDELDLLGWHYAGNHLLFAAARITLNQRTKLFTEDAILRNEEVKALRAKLVKAGLFDEITRSANQAQK